jgi:hypothetical protein
MRHKLTILPLITALLVTPTFGQLDDEFHGRQNATINFYGKVVDQDGKPLEGAKVDIDLIVGEWKTLPTAQKQPFVQLQTDKITEQTAADGTFTLRLLTGHGIEIKSIAKEGYDSAKHIKKSYYYSATAEPFRADSNNPVVFVLWDQKRKIQLITKDKNYEIIPDGRLYAINLKTRHVAEATNDDGDLQFQMTRPKGVGTAGKFAWSFSVEPRHGILIAPIDQDYFTMCFPLNDGYTNKFQETHQTSDRPWKQAGWKQFYIKMKDGRSYAKMALVWDAVAAANGPKTNYAGIRIQYTLNPGGSALTQ